MDLVETHLTLCLNLQNAIESLNSLCVKLNENYTSMHIDMMRRLAVLESVETKSYNYLNMRHILECTQRRLTKAEKRLADFDQRLCYFEGKAGIDVVDGQSCASHDPWSFSYSSSKEDSSGKI